MASFSRGEGEGIAKVQHIHIGPASELADDKDDLGLIEEIEDFALEDMAKLLYYVDPQHPLLVAVSSMKDLGFNQENMELTSDSLVRQVCLSHLGLTNHSKLYSLILK